MKMRRDCSTICQLNNSSRTTSVGQQRQGGPSDAGRNLKIAALNRSRVFARIRQCSKWSAKWNADTSARTALMNR